MTQPFCFSVLALKPKYWCLAKSFADDISAYAPGTPVVVGTDNPDAFQDCQNVIAFPLKQQGILHCYHDKRFVLEKALSLFSLAIQIDADTRFLGGFPEPFHQPSAIAAVHVENLVEHAKRYNPERLFHLHKLAEKLEVDIERADYVGESLFSVSAEGETAETFIHYWHRIAQYLELHGIHAGEGNAIGLAAAKAGLEIVKPQWLVQIHQARQHLNASESKPIKTVRGRVWRSINYHYRFNRARIAALKDVDFYYR